MSQEQTGEQWETGGGAKRSWPLQIPAHSSRSPVSVPLLFLPPLPGRQKAHIYRHLAKGYLRPGPFSGQGSVPVDQQGLGPGAAWDSTPISGAWQCPTLISWLPSPGVSALLRFAVGASQADGGWGGRFDSCPAGPCPHTTATPPSKAGLLLCEMPGSVLSTEKQLINTGKLTRP